MKTNRLGEGGRERGQNRKGRRKWLALAEDYAR